MADISERLALIIDAKTGGAVTEIQKVTKSSEDLAVTQDKAALSAARMTAAQDKLAASLAKQQVAEARAAGDTEKLAEAQTASAAASEKANVSKAQAAIAADKLRVSELTAKDATAALGVEATASGGMLDKLGLSAVGLGEALTAIGPLLVFAAIAAGIKFLADGVKHFEELNAQVRTFKAVTGASTTEASLLVGQLKQLGVDPDAAAKAFQRFGAAIGDGSSKINDFGIATARNKDGTVDLVGTLENLRNAYQNSGDAATRDAIAKQLGLRQATALIPLLQQNRQQIEALNAATKASGGIVTDSDQRNALALKVAANEMKQSFANLEMDLAKFFIPALAEGVHLISDFVHILNSINDVGPKLSFQLDPQGKVGAALKRAYDDGKISAEAYASALKKIGDAGAAQRVSDEQDAAAVQKLKEAQDTLTQSLTGELDAKRAVRDATNQLVDARQAEVDAQASLDKLLKDGAVDEKAVADAKKQVASASRALRDAQESEQKAQENLNKARERASALDLAEASNKLALSGDRITSAKAAEQEAQEKLDALLGSGDATKGQIAAAQADLASKHDEVTQAVIEQGRATENLAAVQKKGTDADPAVLSSQRDLRDAHERVQTAIDNQKDALDRLHEAEAGDPDYARKVADAREGLARAHQRIADAQDNQITTALRLKDATEKLNGALSATPGLAVEQGVLAEILALKAQGLNVDALLALLPAQLTQGGGFQSSVNVFGTTVPLTGHRASGGPLEPFGRYLVAEPGTGGEIITLGAMGGHATPVNGRGHTITNHVYVDANSKNIGQEVAAELSWSLRTTILPRINPS